MTGRSGYLTPLLLAILALSAYGQTYRTSFEEGDQEPKGWTSSPKDCKWVTDQAHTGKRSVCVVGTESSSVVWRSTDVKFQPGAFYRLTFYYRVDHTGEGGSSTTGASFAYRDFRPKEAWGQEELIFQALHEERESFLRLAHWHLPGTIYFDDVALERIGIAYQTRDGIALGRDEKIENGVYQFKTNLRTTYSNCYRVVDAQKLTYHSGWWEFRNNTYLVFRFRVAGHRQQSGRITFLIANFLKGAGSLSVSKDKKTWRELARLEDRKERGEYEFDLPGDLFPADEIYVRIAVDGSASFNLNQFEYTAKLDGSPPDLVGYSRWFRGHFIVADTGPMRLIFEGGRPELVQIWQGERQMGALRLAVAQFEKEGLGYKGSGVGLADATTVKQIVMKEKTPERCVVDVVVERTESAETQRRFEATVRIEALAGQDWFRCRVVSVKNTDAIAYEARGYCCLLQPGPSKTKTAVNFPACAGWLVDGVSLGCASVGEDGFTFSFRQEEGQPRGEVSRRLCAKLSPDGMWEAKEPDVIVYLGGEAKKHAIFAGAKKVRALADGPPSAVASGAIRYTEAAQKEAKAGESK